MRAGILLLSVGLAATVAAQAGKVPSSAPPAEAPAARPDPTGPPHPALPALLKEKGPGRQTVGSTPYTWVSGHWRWTGARYEWRAGFWAYPLSGYRPAGPLWRYQTGRWTFYEAGWAKKGTESIEFAFVPVPRSGGQRRPEVTGARTTVYKLPAGGAYVAPLVLFPRWHPFYRYHHAKGHPAYRKPPSATR